MGLLHRPIEISQYRSSCQIFLVDVVAAEEEESEVEVDPDGVDDDLGDGLGRTPPAADGQENPEPQQVNPNSRRNSCSGHRNQNLSVRATAIDVCVCSLLVQNRLADPLEKNSSALLVGSNNRF